MKNAFALVVASLLAAGCASAQAQDDPPAPQPHEQHEGRDHVERRRAPEADPRVRDEQRAHEVVARAKEAHARLQDAEARLAQLKEVEKRPDSDPEVRRALETLELARNALRDARARIAPGDEAMAHGAGQGPRGRELRFGEGRPRVEGGGHGRFDGSPPNFEQRLEQLERAVREMHAMFERHNLPPEARERAEREMRERRAGPRPEERGHPGGPGQPQGPGRRDGPMGPGGPGDAGGPDRPPRPPARMPRVELSPEEKRALEQAAGADEARKQLDGARAEIDALRRQLEETRAAMEKMRAELEQLREKK